MNVHISKQCSTQVSASGKILIIGGYAILEQPNPGLVLASTARFHTTISIDKCSDRLENDSALCVKVHSPQYRQQLEYRCRTTEDDRIEITSTRSECRNSYVEQTLGHALTAARCVFGSGATDIALVLKFARAQCKEPLKNSVFETLSNHFQLSEVPGEVVVGTKCLNGLSKDLQIPITYVLAFGSLMKLGPHEVARLLEQVSPESDISNELQSVTENTAAEFDKLVTLGTSDNPVKLTKTSFEFIQVYCARNGCCLNVLLQADNDFYSQSNRLLQRNLPLTSESLRSLQPFLPCVGDGEDSGSVAKTGLGSSAAMITSLTASLLSLFGLVDIAGSVPSEDDMELVHRVAQIAHGVAQGKIGSGFDVCAAVHGNIRYVRYSPTVIQPVMDWPTEKGFPPSQIMMECQDNNTRVWDHSVKKFTLPPRLRLICGDICGGSETPSMSRKILAWKRAEGDIGEANRVKWGTLITANKAVEDALSHLTTLSSCDDMYDQTLQAFSSCNCKTELADKSDISAEILAAISTVASCFVTVRTLLKEIGQEAGVPVEPDCQTDLCNATASLPGVVACGVPGAGGYDAVFALYVGGELTRSVIEAFWEKRPNNEVCPLLLSEVDATDASATGLKVSKVFTTGVCVGSQSD